MIRSRKLFFKMVVLLLALGFLPLGAQPVHGQDGITLEEPGATIDYGKTITFHAKVKTAFPVQQITLLFRGETQERTYMEPVEVAADGSVNFVYNASLNLIPPFSKILFWFDATLSDGQTYSSEKIPVFYDDTRFPWSQVTRANVTVHWYAGNNDIAIKAHDMAALGMLEMKDIFPVEYENPIHIYIYSNTLDLQTTLALGGKDWVGGHSIPETGIALVAIPPEALNAEFATYEFEKKIPHEVAHVLLYRAIGGDKYAKQPRWLIEGIATMMEQYADPEFDRALNAASKKDALIPFTKLCESFPIDSGSAYLAYAESQSFVKYIYESYGKSGLLRLIDEYGDGVNCELGATRTLGIPLSQLDMRWRENVLGQNVAGVAARNLSPFVLIMALVLVVPLWGMIDLLRQRKKREEQYAPKPKFN